MNSEKNTEKQNKHPHDGHRGRMKQQVLKYGASNLNETELLEMLLYYVLPRCDTKEHAKKLLETFGSLGDILGSRVGALNSIPGLKDNAEVFFILLRELVSRFGMNPTDVSIHRPQTIKSYLVDLYKTAKEENVYAIYFNTDGCHVSTQLIFRGGISSAKFSLRAITEGAIRSGANSLILAHNHPSGVLVPSGDDIISTKRIASHLAANDINLIEHYIVGKDDAVGMFSLE